MEFLSILNEKFLISYRKAQLMEDFIKIDNQTSSKPSAANELIELLSLTKIEETEEPHLRRGVKGRPNGLNNRNFKLFRQKILLKKWT